MAELLWAVVVTVAGVVWVVFCETELVLVLSPEPLGAVVVAVVDIKAVTGSVLETEDTGVVDCLTVLAGWLVWLEVTAVTFSAGGSRNVSTGAEAQVIDLVAVASTVRHNSTKTLNPPIPAFYSNSVSQMVNDPAGSQPAFPPS